MKKNLTQKKKKKKRCEGLISTGKREKKRRKKERKMWLSNIILDNSRVPTPATGFHATICPCLPAIWMYGHSYAHKPPHGPPPSHHGAF
jgi:hypothetical protein